MRSRLKKYLVGEICDLTQEEAKVFGYIAVNYEVDQSDLLFYCPATKEAAADRDKLMRLVTFCITITRACRVAIKKSVVPMIGSAIISIGEGYIRVYSDMWENELIAKQAKNDLGSCVSHLVTFRQNTHSRSLPWIMPKTFNSNPELLIFVDQFSGYVITKARASRSAQTIAETYEECVFRRFGASEVIRHDREPAFMSDFFKPFNKILG
ncbi:reverse transcriptase [Phytophthora megakarya]|uniref:Reverse transcriptase n=1 Tax=Phytophthora megakarya TaxID=4795 RepID=A0A225UYT5_9STRA|nr:reverse transcriptase [Phytophthora megakarya]